MATRRTRPLALMKLTSSSRRPGAATPAVMGQSVAITAMDSATPRRQKARVRWRTASGSADPERQPEGTVAALGHHPLHLIVEREDTHALGIAGEQ